MSGPAATPPASPPQPPAPPAPPPPLQLVVMGVSGCGKTSLGQALAQALGAVFLEGDSLHPPANVARMAAGTPLTDDDRREWLAAIGRLLGQARADGRALVASCSALKRSYRDGLRAACPGLRFVMLHGSAELLRQRMAARPGHYMPAALLQSQLATLQWPGPDEHIAVLPIDRPLATQLHLALDALGRAGVGRPADAAGAGAPPAGGGAALPPSAPG